MVNEKMIQQISLKGFQSHIDSLFNLGTGLNVITGPSDAGKTAIIRAVRWVAFNEPQGEAFVNESVGSAEVKLFLADGTIITKTRKKSKTSYLIQADETDDGSLFEKSEVPLEVKRLLGIEKHSFGDFEAALNFSFQLDAPFLISETASAGAKVLGKLAGTESVDLAIKGVSKDTHATRSMRSQAEKDMERITGSLLEYQHIDDAQQMLETAEMILEQVETSKSKFDNLKEYKHQYELVQERIIKYFSTLERLAHVPALEEDLKDIEKSQQRYDQLLQLYSDGHRFQERINVLGQDLEKYQELDAANETLRQTETAAERLSTIIFLRQSYQKYSHDVKSAEHVLEKVKDTHEIHHEITELEKNVKTLLDLRTLKFEYQNTSNRLQAAKERSSLFNDLQTADEIINSLAGDVERLAVLTAVKSEQMRVLVLTSKARSQYDESVQKLFEAEHELQEAWQEAGGVCPLCEQAHDGGVC